MRPYQIQYLDSYEEQIINPWFDLDHVQGFTSPIIVYPAGRPVWKFDIRLAFSSEPLIVGRRIPLWRTDSAHGDEPSYPSDPSVQTQVEYQLNHSGSEPLISPELEDPYLVIEGIEYFNIRFPTMIEAYERLLQPFYDVYEAFENAWRTQPPQQWPPIPGPHFDDAQETQQAVESLEEPNICYCETPKVKMGSKNCARCGKTIINLDLKTD